MGSSGVLWVKVRDIAKHFILCIVQLPTGKNCPAPNVKSDKGEKSWSNVPGYSLAPLVWLFYSQVPLDFILF